MNYFFSFNKHEVSMAERRKRLSYNRRWVQAKRQSRKPNDLPSADVSSIIHSRSRSSSRSSSSITSSSSCSDDDLDMECDVESVSETENGTGEEQNSLSVDLVEWINSNGITHKAADDLLKIIKHHFNTDLPNSARTLLKTSRTVEVIDKSGMEYVSLGFKNQLILNLRRYPQDLRCSLENLSLSLNIDGIPLFRSSPSSLWPVLCSINLDPVVVFPVVLTYGKTKPQNLDFLFDMVIELRDLIENGLMFETKAIKISLCCIVCDAPAKALVKGTKQYSGYYGCDMCSQKGVWLGRMTYQDVDNLTERTDLEFRTQSQKEHHNTLSPFCQLPINMVTTFSIDYMHQVCLGVTKKLLLMWTKGSRDFKLSATQQNQISQHLLQLKPYIPSVFARKPRGLEELERWKATEFRQFLLYTGKIVLKDVLRPKLYLHFLSLSVAICILVCPRLLAVEEHRIYANDLLVYFVKEGRNIYGPEFLVYNVHSLLHLSQNIHSLQVDSLDHTSAFVFENFMQVLKKSVRSGKKPLVQIVKRLSEINQVTVSVEKQKVNLKSKAPNNIYFIKNTDSICEIVSSHVDENGDTKYLCRRYRCPGSIFLSPCDSKFIGVFQCDVRHTELVFLRVNDLKRRAMKIKMKENMVVFMAILHEF